MRTSVLNTITVFVWRMIRLNFFFALANAVLLFTLLFVPLSLITLPIYAVAALLLVPSLTALLLAMKRMDDASPPLRKLYFKGYREEFKGSLRFAIAYVLGALVLFIAFMLIQDMPTPIPVAPLYFLLTILLYVHLIFGLLIRVNFIIDIKGTWRLGMYCISKYPLIALLILAGTIVIGVIIPVLPFLLPLGVIPAAFYLLSAATKKMIRNITSIVKIAENKEDKTIESEDDSQ